MKCEECQDFIDAYVDNELDAAATIVVQRHLRDCPACREFLESRKSLQTLLATPELRFEVPDSLRVKVLSALPVAPAGLKPRPRVVIPWSFVPFVPWALAAALAVVLGLAILYRGTGPAGSRDRILVEQVISSHVRSLLATHLLDVPSTDQHTVKPWFAGKLEFSPPVQDFADRGFPLIGGRLDYLDTQDVAALVYRRNKHLINLFIWPSPPGHASPVESVTEKGYNVVHWNRGGFFFWAVSDVRTEDLRALADLVNQQL